MLETIYKIGEEISAGRDPWEDVLNMSIQVDDRDGKIRFLQLPIHFDLDNKRVEVGSPQIFDNDFDNLRQLRCIKTQTGNYKAHYPCILSGKPNLLYKTLFGKLNGKEVFQGELASLIEKDAPELTDSLLIQVLTEIFHLKDSFLEVFLDEDKGKISPKYILEAANLAKNERLALIYASVTWEKFQLTHAVLGGLEGFDAFIEKRFINSKNDSSQEETQKLCYASGTVQPFVQTAEFSERYNINKFFVKTTYNYATNFEEKLFHKNYQLNNNIEQYLDRGSSYLLKHFRVTIADIPHVIIPQLFHQDPVHIRTLERIKSGSELLFHLNYMEEVNNYLENNSDDETELYWINFLAIDSDGKYFKVANLIKDVPKFHFEAILWTICESQKRFKPWLSSKYGFNLYGMYKAIPVRKDKEKTNEALGLFSALLENRKISLRNILHHFVHLILCHRYKRYPAYPNIFPNENFDFAAKDAVFTYMAFIYTLRQLNQLKDDTMNTEPSMSPVETHAPKFLEEIYLFFQQMRYTDQQQGLFFLGRALSQVAYVQQEKGYTKRILDKVNFNGMDARSLARLSESLFEKGKEYRDDQGRKMLLDKIIWNIAEFNRHFHPGHWRMDPIEALFFLLSGYTYAIKKKSPIETQEN